MSGEKSDAFEPLQEESAKAVRLGLEIELSKLPAAARIERVFLALDVDEDTPLIIHRQCVNGAYTYKAVCNANSSTEGPARGRWLKTIDEALISLAATVIKRVEAAAAEARVKADELEARARAARPRT